MMTDDDLLDLRLAREALVHARNSLLSSNGARRRHHARAHLADSVRMLRRGLDILAQLESRAWDSGEPATEAEARAMGIIRGNGARR
jgi:hypothetical protein